MKGLSKEVNGNSLIRSAESKVLIFPSLAEREGRIYFLFSLRQVEDIIKEIRVWPVPFSAPHIEGITEWRGRVLPVLSLEKCLGMKGDPEAHAVSRFITVRLRRERKGGPEEERMMFRVSPSIRIRSLPLECSPAPISSCPGILRPNLLRALYAWSEGMLAVIHPGEIFLIGN